MKGLFSRTWFVQQLNQRFTVFAVVTVLVLLTAGFVIVINPEISAIRSFGLVRLQQTRADRNDVAESLRLTRSVVESYRLVSVQDSAKLQSVLPSSSDLPAMFIQVEAIALSAGLRLNNISFTTTAPARRSGATTPQSAPPGFQQLQVTFNVTGGRGYPSLKNFLATVESSVRLLDVQSISYSPQKTSDEETYVINAVSYSQGQ